MSTTASSAAADTDHLQLEYRSSHSIASQPTSWWRTVLGVVGFEKPPSLDRGKPSSAGIPVAASMTPSLGSADLCEVWRVAGPQTELSNGEPHGRVKYRYSDDLLFGALTIAEQGLEARSETDGLFRATEIAYQEIFDILDSTEHRHLIRVWNYLPDINAHVAGDERYRHFNSARQAAFLKSGRAIMGTVPAASALGSPSGNALSIYFLAGRKPPKTIENPRQTSAYYYPAKFGKHSPIFSRACVWGGEGSGRLFISGTASIVGHETVHAGDVIAQTRETLTNIGALLEEANRAVGVPRYSLDAMQLKVYVRKPVDLPEIQATLSKLLHPTASIVYLQADVCRRDLLVEIEAVG